MTRRTGLEAIVRAEAPVPTLAVAVTCTTPDFVPALNVVYA